MSKEKSLISFTHYLIFLPNMEQIRFCIFFYEYVIILNTMPPPSLKRSNNQSQTIAVLIYL